MANNQELLAEAIMELNLGSHPYADQIFEAYQEGMLLTFNEWKKLGYSVKKGQKSLFSCSLWKKVSEKDSESDEAKEADSNKKGKAKRKFIMKKCCFFLPSQVEKIQKRIAS